MHERDQGPMRPRSDSGLAAMIITVLHKGALMSNERSGESVVFIVDDDHAFRAAVGRLVRSIGLNVVLLDSAREFLAQKLPNAPCCLVLDVRLPGLGGLDFQAELAKVNIRTPIIFLTAYGDIPM